MDIAANQAPLLTQDQKRAKLVYDNVKKVEQEPVAKKYGSLALSAATLIRQCGLVQAIAFYEAKGEEHCKRLVSHLQDELEKLGLLQSGQGLRATSMNCDLTTFMRLTRETLALCQWHKRFAQSILKAQAGED